MTYKRVKRVFCLVTIAVLSTVTVAAVSAADKSFESPLLITDVGQGNNAKLLEILLKRNKEILFQVKELAGPEDLKGIKSILIGVGASTKGLGAAGLDIDQEMSRTKELIRAAKEKNLPIIGVHIGGMAKRGELSDKFVEEVFRNSDAFIAWQGGNEDGFLSDLAEESRIDFHLVEKKNTIGKILEELITSSSSLSLPNDHTPSSS